MERRWLVRLAPPVAGALAVGILAATSIGATDAPWDPPPCPGGLDRLASVARADPPSAPRDVGDEAWFTLDPLLDSEGALAGQRLRIGTRDADRTRFVDLAPESTASGPFGRLVLGVADDGRQSTIRAIDVRAGCATLVATSPDVIRGATLDAAGTATYEHRVDRRTRADLGIWRRPLDGAAARRVLAPNPARDVVGLVFSTTLGWSAEGDALVVQHCGAVRCRTRVLSRGTGAVSAVADAGHGELIGVASGLVVAYEPCAGLPCPIAATDLATGRRVVLHARAGLARLVATADGPRVAVEDGPEGARLEVRRLDGTLDRAIDLPDPSLRLMPAMDRARAGTRLPPGWVVLARDGRSPSGAILARLDDGSTVGLLESIR